MAAALNRFSEQSGLRILFPFEGVQSMTSRPVNARMDDRKALEQMIAKTRLRIASMRDNVVVITLTGTAKASAANNAQIGDTEDLARPASALGGPAPEEPIIVTGRRISQAAEAIGTDRVTQTVAVTRKALLSAPPGISGLKMLEYLPGFNVQTDGPLGLYEFGNSVQVRAFNLDEIGFMLDGIPMGRSDAFGGSPVFRYVDNENLAGVDASPGAGDVTQPSYASLGPMVRYTSIEPQDDFGVFAEQSLGSDDLRRSFVRVSSGRVGPIRGYVSYTRLNSDLWRGAGTIDRSHWESQIRADLGSHSWFRLKFVANNFYDYDSPSLTRATYESAQGDLGGKTGRDRGYIDFLPVLAESAAGVPYSNTGYTYYYGNAVNSRSDRLYGATLHLAQSAGTSLELTGYHEDKRGFGVSADSYANSLVYYTQQAAAGLKVTAPRGVQYGYSGMSGQRQGLVASLKSRRADHEIEAGLWAEVDDYHRTQYRLNLANGAPNGAVLADETVYYRRNYQSRRRALQYWLRDRWTPGQGPLTIEAGVKGLDLDYSLSGYRDFEDYAHTDGTAGWGPQTGRAHWFSGFLPNLGALYRLGDGRTQVFGSYARNMAMPKGMDSIASVAFASTSAIAPKPNAERSQNFELGIRTNQPRFFAVATFYHIRFDNLISAISAPVPGSIGEIETYYQNVGGVEANGFEAAATIKPAFLSGKVYFNANLTYSDATFRDDLPDGTKIAGNRLPDSAALIVSGGVTAEPASWALANISARYTGKRYADYTNTQSVGGQLVVDAYVELGGTSSLGPLHAVRARLNVDNLFDRDALSFIYPIVSGEASYRPLSPRTVQLTLSGEF